MSILSSTFACQTHTYQSAPTTALDVYKPANHSPASRHKTLILFHGGGLTTGSRDVFIPVGIATQLLNRGWIVISADYSLLPQASGLSLLRNLANIETWITENAAKEGIDTTNVAVGGESAGGYMSVLAASHWKTLKPKALVDMFGMVDLRAEWYAAEKSEAPVLQGTRTADIHEAEFAEMLANPTEITSDAPNFDPGSRFRFIFWLVKHGTVLEFILGRHEIQRKMGVEPVPAHRETELLPFDFVTKLPPSWVIHGSADSIVPTDDSRRFVQELKKAGVEAEYIEIAGAEHGLQGLSADQGDDHAVAFLEKWVR